LSSFSRPLHCLSFIVCLTLSEWKTDNERQTMKDRQCKTDNERQTMKDRQWKTDNERQTMKDRQRKDYLLFWYLQTYHNYVFFIAWYQTYYFYFKEIYKLISSFDWCVAAYDHLLISSFDWCIAAYGHLLIYIQFSFYSNFRR
jgi:hypothetical protein